MISVRSRAPVAIRKGHKGRRRQVAQPTTAVHESPLSSILLVWFAPSTSTAGGSPAAAAAELLSHLFPRLLLFLAALCVFLVEGLALFFRQDGENFLGRLVHLRRRRHDLLALLPKVLTAAASRFAGRAHLFLELIEVRLLLLAPRRLRLLHALAHGLDLLLLFLREAELRRQVQLAERCDRFAQLVALGDHPTEATAARAAAETAAPGPTLSIVLDLHDFRSGRLDGAG
jgi:hypothetical protein